MYIDIDLWAYGLNTLLALWNLLDTSLRVLNSLNRSLLGAH